jgi:hypothetical protein
MYTISNQDRDYIIKFLDLMIANTPQTSLRVGNSVRLAGLLKRKLEAKQPLRAADMPLLERLLLRNK